MKNLLFLIYGDQRVYHLELTYSILSAARFLDDTPTDVRIVLAADERNQRPDLPVEQLLISPDQMRDWTMGGTYHHALKINVLDHVLEYHNSPTILVDSDTVFLGHPVELFDRVSSGTALMHASEGALQDSDVWPEWESLIQHSGGQVAGWPIGPKSVMFNSGLLGLDPSDRALLEDVKSVLESIRIHTHMFTAEQLAASLVLQQRLAISLGRDLVEHYWHGPRAFFHYQMAHMFPDVRRGGGILDVNMSLPLLQRQMHGKVAHKIAARLKRVQRGQSAEFEFAYRGYLNAIAHRHTDPELANVWAVTALNTLTWGMGAAPPARADVQRDFARFAPPQLDAQDWMTPDLRARWRAYWSAALSP